MGIFSVETNLLNDTVFINRRHQNSDTKLFSFGSNASYLFQKFKTKVGRCRVSGHYRTSWLVLLCAESQKGSLGNQTKTFRPSLSSTNAITEH
jgi:hypothetical protein